MNLYEMNFGLLKAINWVVHFLHSFSPYFVQSYSNFIVKFGNPGHNCPQIQKAKLTDVMEVNIDPESTLLESFLIWIYFIPTFLYQ